MDLTGKAFPGRADLWLDAGVVVRRHDQTALATVEWIHRFLDRLDFNAPKPVPYFDGASVAEIDGGVWSAVTYVHGEIVGWSPQPSMFELGAFLATFHAAAASVETEEQQSPVFPVQVPGQPERLRHVIHGDFTNHNVVSSGSPPRPCGVIDFANACIDVPLFDLGCALWRSGRPAQDVHEFAPERVVAYVDGYCSVRPLSRDDRAAVADYLRARGEQIIAKQAARGITDDGPNRKLEWLAHHQDQLVAALIDPRDGVD